MFDSSLLCKGSAASAIVLVVELRSNFSASLKLHFEEMEPSSFTPFLPNPPCFAVFEPQIEAQIAINPKTAIETLLRGKTGIKLIQNHLS